MSNILVIEDDDIMLKAIRNILRKDGHEVITAKDGKEAFEKLDNEQYDVVITDLMMPGTDGKAFCRKIKEEECTSHIPVIMLTALASTVRG